ncbi:MAG: helix-turn-helix domain-containing protein [Sulfurovaceae bacterium]|nr:helix-turn-helix domain-containing protein [Sulfurovaceae bacterium]
MLISKRGYCVVGEEIMAIVWENSFEEDISCDSVKRQVSYLRKKLPDIIIQNVYGQGYLLK